MYIYKNEEVCGKMTVNIKFNHFVMNGSFTYILLRARIVYLRFLN
jgi:hypothetical protein